MSNSSKSEDYRLARAMQEIFRNAVQACMDGETQKLRDIVTSFVKDHPESSPKDVIVGFQSEGKTLLHVAASSGKAPVLSTLVELMRSPSVSAAELRSLVNLQDDRGFTPLMNATIAESSESMQQLISLGADVTLSTKEGATALHFAAADGNVSRMQILCASNTVDLNASSASGSVLHWAAGKGHADAVRFLLQHTGPKKVDVNQVTKEGVSAVLMAAVAGSDEAVAHLVDAGADVGAIVTNNLTVLHICAEHGMQRAVEAILKTPTGVKCCSVATSDGDNWPIHLAAMSQHRDIVRMLLPHSRAIVPGEVVSEGEDKEVEWMVQEGARRSDLWHAQHAKQQEQSKSTSSASNSSNSSSHDASSAAAFAYFDALPGDVADAALAETHRTSGNLRFKEGDFAGAASCYTDAIAANKSDALHWSNRSACYLLLKDHAQALRDAEICRRLRPDWPKACFRLAQARLALGRYEDAAVAAFEGCKLEPGNKELKALVDKAVKLGQEEHRRKQQEQQEAKKI